MQVMCHVRHVSWSMIINHEILWSCQLVLGIVVRLKSPFLSVYLLFYKNATQEETLRMEEVSDTEERISSVIWWFGGNWPGCGWCGWILLSDFLHSWVLMMSYAVLITHCGGLQWAFIANLSFFPTGCWKRLLIGCQTVNAAHTLRV